VKGRGKPGNASLEWMLELSHNRDRAINQRSILVIRDNRLGSHCAVMELRDQSNISQRPSPMSSFADGAGTVDSQGGNSVCIMVWLGKCANSRKAEP
jgi:hypothetical protein